MEVYRYHGIQEFDLTTGAFLGNPERAFELAGRLNTQVEVYPFLDQKYLEVFKNLARFAGKILPPFSMIPQGISEDNLKKWVDKYKTPIIRFHLPWFYDSSDLESLKNDENYFKIVGRSYAMEKVISYFMGTMVSNHGLSLAEKFNAGVNVHPNVLAGLIRLGKINEVKSKVKFMLAENSVDCKLFPRNSYFRETLYDLDSLVTKIVLPYHVDGLLWARDHHKDEENAGLDRNYREIMKSNLVRENIWAIHLTGINHRLVNPNDPEDREFLKELSNMKTKHPLRAALDIDPQILIGKSVDEQESLLKKTIDGIMQVN